MMRQTKRERTRPDPDQIRLLRIALSSLLLLSALSALFPRHLFWGINHLAYLHPLAPILLAVVGLLLVWSPAATRLGGWLKERAAPFFLRGRLIPYVVGPLVGGALFWVLRCKTHFLGDGWLLGQGVGRGVLFHGFNLFQYHMTAKLFRWLGWSGDSEAFRLFALVSVVAGILYLIAVAWSVKNLCKDSGDRIWLYALLVFFAPVQMFMGYVECYSMLTVSMLVFVTSIVLHYRGALPVWVPAIALGVGLAFHLNALFLAPLLLPLVFWPAKHASQSVLKRFASVSVAVLVPLALVVALYLLEGYDSVKFRADFVQHRQTHALLVPLQGPHALLSWHHWKDILNLLILLVPVPTALLIGVVGGKRLRVSAGARSSEKRRPRGLTLLLAGSAWLVLLMILVNMKLGIARDWDLFAAHAPIIVMAACMAWFWHTGRGAGNTLIGATVITAVCLSLPWFWLNAGEARSVERFRDIIEANPPFSRAYAHEEIGAYYHGRGMVTEALNEYRTATEVFPENARFHAVLGALQYTHKMSDDALVSLGNALAADSTFRVALELTARIHTERGELSQALLYARRLARDSKEPSRAAALHGWVAEQLGLFDEAIEAYGRAIDKDPNRTDLAARRRNLLSERQEGQEIQKAQ